MRTEFLWISVLRVASGPRVKLAGRGAALNPRWFVLLTVLGRLSRCWTYFLLLCDLFYEAICFSLVSVLCHFVIDKPPSLSLSLCLCWKGQCDAPEFIVIELILLCLLLFCLVCIV